MTTAFVEACVETAADSAQAEMRRRRGRPSAKKLLKLLATRKTILITTHQHPDPDALASALGMQALLNANLPDAKVEVSVKGKVGGGVNEAFVRYAKMSLTPWDESSLSKYDAILLLDAQPTFAYCPFGPETKPTAVIDHHSKVGRRSTWEFCDVRKDVGATSSIVFSYFMETETPIGPALAATLLFGVETDLAGAAGTPSELDNLALSSLTLLADTRRLYQMRYVVLPQSYYVAYAQGLATAQLYEHIMVAELAEIDSLEKPAVLADFLLRYDQIDGVLVTGVYGDRLILSLRTNNPRDRASDLIKRLIRNIGRGGGHRTKAGGFVPLETGTENEIQKIRQILTRRYRRAMGIQTKKATRLV